MMSTNTVVDFLDIGSGSALNGWPVSSKEWSVSRGKCDVKKRDVCKGDLAMLLCQFWNFKFGGDHHIVLNKSVPAQLVVKAVIIQTSWVREAAWFNWLRALLTGREPRSSPGRLHLLSRMGEHVVALGLVDQITTRLRGLNQLLVVHHVQQVGRVDERKAHHCQQLRQILRKWEE